MSPMASNMVARVLSSVAEMAYFVADRVQGKGNPWTLYDYEFVAKYDTISLIQSLKRWKNREVIRISADTYKEAKSKLPL